MKHPAGVVKRGTKTETRYLMWGKQLEWDRYLLAEHIGEWLSYGIGEGIRLRFSWWNKAPDVTLESGWAAPLWGYLVRELVFVSAGVDGAVLCAGCGRFFLPTERRKPAHNRRAWCPECQDAGAPQRQAKRDQRARARPSPKRRP
jgi:hypothetical protein